MNSVPNAPENSASDTPGNLSNIGGGKALAGFLLSGFELALLGAILPAWGYHRDPPQFVAVGNYFLALAIGIVFAALVYAESWTATGSPSCRFSPARFPACP